MVLPQQTHWFHCAVLNLNLYPAAYCIIVDSQWLCLYCGLLIGASLGEPYTGVTALSTCVCIYHLDQPLTGIFQMSAFNIAWTMWRPVRAFVRVQHQRPTAKMIQVEAWMQLVYVFFISYLNCRLWQASFTADYLQTMGWLELPQVRVMYKLHSRDSAHNLLSPCICPSLVHACVAITPGLTDNRQSRTLLLSVVCVPWQYPEQCAAYSCRLAPWCWSIFIPLSEWLSQV